MSLELREVNANKGNRVICVICDHGVPLCVVGCVGYHCREVCKQGMINHHLIVVDVKVRDDVGTKAGPEHESVWAIAAGQRIVRSADQHISPVAAVYLHVTKAAIKHLLAIACDEGLTRSSGNILVGCHRHGQRGLRRAAMTVVDRVCERILRDAGIGRQLIRRVTIAAIGVEHKAAKTSTDRGMSAREKTRRVAERHRSY